MVYQWSEGFNDLGKNARACADRLEAVRHDAGGVLYAQDVVADAAKDGSPLHPFFEWNDKRAAHAYRLEQATVLVRAIVVRRSKERPDRQRHMYCAAPREAENPPGFALTAATPLPMQVQAKMPNTVEDALRDLGRWRVRYGSLPQFADAIPAIDRVLGWSADEVAA